MERKSIASFLVLGLLAFSVHAGPAVTITTTNSSTGFSPDTSQDLVLGLLPTLTGGTLGRPSTLGPFTTLNCLTDASVPSSPDQPVTNSNYAYVGNKLHMTFNLGAMANISSIQTFTAWQDNGRSQQQYTVDVSQDGVNFSTGYITVPAEAGPATNPSDLEVSIVSADGVSMLATNVQYIRFNFGNSSGNVQNSDVAYTEIIINGTLPTVPTAPIFTLNPVSAVVTNTARSVPFTSSVYGYPPPTYQWHFIDTNGIDNVLPQTSLDITLPIATATDVGSYYIVASNSVGMTNSTLATLTVTDPTNMPIIETVYSLNSNFDPLNTNSDILLSLTAAELALPIMTDGSDLGNGPAGTNFHLFFSGDVQTFALATNSTLNEIDVYSSWQDNGRVNQNYTVSVSTNNGVNYSNLYTVAAVPSLLYASATPNNLRVQLTPNGNPALASPVDHIRFSFNNVQNGNVGYMEFMVYGSNAPVPFSRPVIISNLPPRATAYQLRPFSLTVAATGNPPPAYQWYFITGGVTNPISGATLPTYSIAQAQLTNGGQYEAIVTNTQGSTNSVICTVTMMGVQGSTNVIYQDMFTNAVFLNGSTPAPVDTNNATWFAWQELVADGTELAVTDPTPTPPNYNNAYLPFTPQVGHIYTLSVGIESTTVTANWMAYGYALNRVLNNYYAANNAGAGWLLQRGNNSEVQVFDGPGLNNSHGGYPGGNAGAFNAYDIILDTTTGNATSGWTITYVQNGIQLRQDVYAANPAIAYVGVGADGCAGNFQNFSLTDVFFQIINAQLGVQQSGGNFTLNWPDIYQGWTLQSNSVGLLNSNAWSTVPGSTGTNQMSLSIDPTRTNVFFRLVAP